ncbi:hypothetical protein DENIS_4465 [Desulfonema ishimotonii]|uniref:Uncharacterized protein n=2 Tax=Desulfonema ishimotonii TaxID=45657 RepID=A0A401G2R9_9BACT|nr:hypothetical protein DENIS_4465 [Desulfonema ishimotonii]
MPLIIRYDGHRDIPNIAARIRALKAKYNNPYRDKDTKRIEALYNVALNEILDCWLTAWTQSGYTAYPYASRTVYQYKARIK